MNSSSNKPATVLSVDTATEVCSVALMHGGQVDHRYVETARDHSSLVLGMVDELLSAAQLSATDLDGLAFGCGPGSFTGVRIATGVAQGIALGADCPVVPVSNLLAIAQRAHREFGATSVLSAIDARMGQVYWGAFTLDDDDRTMRACGDEAVTNPDSVELPERGSAGA